MTAGTNGPQRSTGPVLIASDSSTDAALIESLLEDEFEPVVLSVDVEATLQAFHQQHPSVLLLGFRDVEASERLYLQLFRAGSQPHRHRAILLCTKEQVKEAYELCRRGLFDDYVLFWPVTYDVTRLHMTVHRALDELAAGTGELPDRAALAAHAQQLTELAPLLSQQLARGQEHIATMGRAVASVEARARRAAVSLLPDLHAVSESLRPLSSWADGVQQAVTPHLQSASAIGSLVAREHARILVIDDDEFQHRIIGRILEAEGYSLMCASSGSEGLALLAARPFELILLDYLMPDMSGLDVLRRVKAQPQLVHIPVIMITGKSERDVVLNSLALGATDFVVKPFERQALVGKLVRALHAMAVGHASEPA